MKPVIKTSCFSLFVDSKRNPCSRIEQKHWHNQTQPDIKELYLQYGKVQISIFICFINKEVNHRHRKSRPGGLRFVFEFAQAAANHFLRKNLQNLRSGTIVATVACRYFPSEKREVCKCDRFCKGNFIVWSLDMSGEFP